VGGREAAGGKREEGVKSGRKKKAVGVSFVSISRRARWRGGGRGGGR